MLSRTLTLDEIKVSFTPVLRAGGARKAIVFGSYARGEADEFSDIDLMIIVDRSDWPFIERFKDFWGLWHVEPHKDLNILVYLPEEIERMLERENPFITRALQEGVVIYEAGPEAGNGPVAASGGA